MGSSALKALGSYEQGEAAMAAAKYNADIARQRGAQEESLLRRQSKAMSGRMRAAIAKAGVAATGSALEALAMSAAEAEIDILNARVGAESEARMSIFQGKTQKRQANLAAAAALAEVAEQAATMGGGGGGGGGGFTGTKSPGVQRGQMPLHIPTNPRGRGMRPY